MDSAKISRLLPRSGRAGRSTRCGRPPQLVVCLAVAASVTAALLAPASLSQAQTIMDDCTQDATTSCTVDVNGSTTGEIETEGDQDWFKVSLEAGKEYQIRVRGTYTDHGTLLDPHLYGVYRVMGGTATQVPGTEDADDGAAFNSEILFVPPHTTGSENYYIAAGTEREDLGDSDIYLPEELNVVIGEPLGSRAEDIWLGTYTVSVDEPPDESCEREIVEGICIGKARDVAYFLPLIDAPIISVDDPSANEVDGEIEFTVSLNRVAEDTVIVRYETADGTAVAGDDFIETSGRVEIEKGEVSATITVDLVTDSTDEDDESFTLELSDPIGGIFQAHYDIEADEADTRDPLGLGLTLTATGTITEGPPVVSIADAIAAEGEDLVFEVSIPSGRSDPVAVSYEITDGSAINPDDYAYPGGSPDGTLTIAANTASAQLRIETVKDGADEGDETMTVTLLESDTLIDGEPTYELDSSPSATGTIKDSMVAVTATPTMLELEEQGSSKSYMVRLLGPPTSDVTVTASDRDDGVTLAGTPLVFTPDNWSQYQQITVAGADDSDKQDDVGTIIHTVTQQGGDGEYEASNVPVAEVTYTVTDNDKTVPGPPRMLRAVAGYEQVTLRWEPPMDDGGHKITDYAVAYKQGTGPFVDTDFAAIGSDALTHTVTGLTNDVTYRFRVRAYNDEGWGGYSDEVQKAPVPQTLSIEAASSFVEEGERARFLIRPSVPTPTDVTVRYEFEGDFAVTALSSSTGHHTGWGPWQVTVQTRDDDVIEPDGYIKLTLESGEYAIAGSASAMIEVRDNDGGRVPGKPNAPRLDAQASTVIRVRWNAPSDLGNPREGILYDVRYRRDGTQAWSDGALGVGLVDVLLEGLDPATTYEVQVRARNARGEGDWSASSQQATLTQSAVRVSIVPQHTVVTEGESISFLLTRSGTLDVRAELWVEETGSMLLRSGYVASCTLRRPQTECTLATVDDANVEDASYVTVTLRPTGSYDVDGPASVTYLVLDDDEYDSAEPPPGKPQSLDIDFIPHPHVPLWSARMSWALPQGLNLEDVKGWRVQWANVACGTTPSTWNSTRVFAEPFQAGVQWLGPNEPVQFKVAAIRQDEVVGTYSDTSCDTTPGTWSAPSASDDLTATFEELPAGHGGVGTLFKFEIRFSRRVAVNRRALASALDVTGGSATTIPPSRLRPWTPLTNDTDDWEVWIVASTDGPVTITLPATADCDNDGAICTQQRQALSQGVTATIPGPGG